MIIPRGRMLAIITIDDEPQTRRIRQSFKLSTAILLCQPSGSATVGYRYLEATSTERTCDLCFCSANLEVMTCVKPQIPDNALNRSTCFTAPVGPAPPPQDEGSRKID